MLPVSCFEFLRSAMKTVALPCASSLCKPWTFSYVLQYTHACMCKITIPSLSLNVFEMYQLVNI